MSTKKWREFIEKVSPLLEVNCNGKTAEIRQNISQDNTTPFLIEYQWIFEISFKYYLENLHQVSKQIEKKLAED